MEKLSYTVEIADNGIIIHDNVLISKEVFQVQNEDYRECYKRGLSDSISSYIAALLADGTETLEAKDKYNIKIEIR